MKTIKISVLYLLFLQTLTTACSAYPSPASQGDYTEVIDSVLNETAEISNIASSPAVPHIIYEKQDSITIEKLLQEAKTLKPEENRMLFFGKKFIGIPYVAHTLEKDDEECLVVNTRELDCTTFVETCLALALCESQDLRTFHSYCQMLTLLRYRGGICNGYPSRLHYFTQWVDDNVKMGFIEDLAHEGHPFLATQNIDIHFMSTHPSSYAKLKEHPEDVDVIRKQELDLKGIKVLYIPNELLNGSPEELKDIKDGDIIGLQTSKDGLDTSHLGLAEWKEGKLHLLNASSLHKAVWTDLKTLFNYAGNQKSMIGIRVLRAKL